MKTLRKKQERDTDTIHRFIVKKRKAMKKTVLLGIVAFAFMMTSNHVAWATTEIATLDIPSDFSDATKWPFRHTETCKPAGKWYISTAYARITDDKKIESVLTTSLDGMIFRYRHNQGNGVPDFIIDFIKTEKGWVRIDVLSEYEKTEELFEKHMLENGVPPEEYGAVCARTLRYGFGRFWDDMFQKLHKK